MTKIFIQNLRNKFNQNIIYSKHNGESPHYGDINGVLYKSHAMQNFDAYFFNASVITNEILQFIVEYGQTIKCFIYHDKGFDKQLYESYRSVCKHIIEEKQYIDDMNTIALPTNLVNTYLYKITNTSVRPDVYCCFLDMYESMPDSLSKVLYPNTNLKIRLFNNANIKDNQNLGELSEIDKPNVLNNSKYFICDNGYYALEAQLCGCIIIDIDNISAVKETESIPDFITYDTFMSNIL